MFKRAMIGVVAVGLLAGCGTAPSGLVSAGQTSVGAQGLFSRISADDYANASAEEVSAIRQAQTAGKSLPRNGRLKFRGTLSIASKAGLTGDPRRAPMALVLVAQNQRIELLERRDTGFKAPDVYLYDKFNVGKKETVTALVTITGGVLKLDGIMDSRGRIEKP